MTGKYLEDLHVGDAFGSDTFSVTEARIIEFARDFDPQPFHLEPTAAQTSVFKGLVASGWHTAAMSMRLFVTGGLQLAGGSVGLGVDELRWPRPVRAGDTLQLQTEILEIRPSKSKPDRGVIQGRKRIRRRRGETGSKLIAISY